jgi:branched-chain amino acid aminotransferase
MTKFAFFKGEIRPIEEARISVMTHAFNYGTGCFEGIRAYWNDEEKQLFVFRLAEHYRRLLRSCRILLISLPYSAEELSRITVDLLRREGWREDAYIRPVAYKATEAVGVRLHNLQDDITVFSTRLDKYIPSHEGARAMVSSWQRVSDNAIPARAKITGSYINSAFIKTEASLAGRDEAIVLNSEGHVAEGSAENLFLVAGGKLVTSLTTDDILEGITRSTVMQLAHEQLGVESVERHIDRSELYLADEAFFCGTGAEIEPIVEIDNRPVGSGKPGPIVSKIRGLYFDAVRGKLPQYRCWCTPVY